MACGSRICLVLKGYFMEKITGETHQNIFVNIYNCKKIQKISVIHTKLNMGIITFS